MKRSLLLALLLALALPAGASLPLGVRNHNPGNVKAGRPPWRGSVGVDRYGHAVFSSPFWGLRAMRINLEAYGRHGLNTPRTILARWDEKKPGVRAQRRHAGYMAKVCRRAGMEPDQVLDMNDRLVLRRLARGIIYGENGVDPYPADLLARAFPERPRRRARPAIPSWSRNLAWLPLCEWSFKRLQACPGLAN